MPFEAGGPATDGAVGIALSETAGISRFQW